MGDNSSGVDALTDDDVCERIRWATDPIKREQKSHIMLVYFSSGPATVDAKEVESIRKLEDATSIPLSCVVLTKARAPNPNASLDWERCKQEVKIELGAIEEDFRSDFILKHIDDDDLNGLDEYGRQAAMSKKVNDEIAPDTEDLPTRERVQQEYVHILGRKRHLEFKQQWFGERLSRPGRPPVPVMLLENHKSQQTDRLAKNNVYTNSHAAYMSCIICSCDVKQLYEKWVELLGYNATLFLLMTEEGILADSKFSQQVQFHSTTH